MATDTRSGSSGYSELRYLAVKPGLHGAQLGLPMMNAAVAACSDWRPNGICIRVRRGLNGLARYYERFGFRRDEQGDVDVAPNLYLEGYKLQFSVR